MNTFLIIAALVAILANLVKLYEFCDNKKLFDKLLVFIQPAMNDIYKSNIYKYLLKVSPKLVEVYYVLSIILAFICILNYSSGIFSLYQALGAASLFYLQGLYMRYVYIKILL